MWLYRWEITTSTWLKPDTFNTMLECQKTLSAAPPRFSNLFFCSPVYPPDTPRMKKYSKDPQMMCVIAYLGVDIHCIINGCGCWCELKRKRCSCFANADVDILSYLVVFVLILRISRDTVEAVLLLLLFVSAVWCSCRGSWIRDEVVGQTAAMEMKKCWRRKGKVNGRKHCYRSETLLTDRKRGNNKDTTGN